MQRRTETAIALTAVAAVGGAALYVFGDRLVPPRDSLPVRYCEALTLETLRSPSSYRRISAQEFPRDGDVSVFVSFDAVNAFNAPIRHMAHCVLGPGMTSWDVPPIRSLSIAGRDYRGDDLSLLMIPAAHRTQGLRK